MSVQLSNCEPSLNPRELHQDEKQDWYNQLKVRTSRLKDEILDLQDNIKMLQVALKNSQVESAELLQEVDELVTS